MTAPAPSAPGSPVKTEKGYRVIEDLVLFSRADFQHQLTPCQESTIVKDSRVHGHEVKTKDPVCPMWVEIVVGKDRTGLTHSVLCYLPTKDANGKELLQALAGNDSNTFTQPTLETQDVVDISKDTELQVSNTSERPGACCSASMGFF